MYPMGPNISTENIMPPYIIRRSCTLHVNVGGGGQFISGADRIFQHKPAIYGPGGPYISGDHIFRDRPPVTGLDPRSIQGAARSQISRHKTVTYFGAGARESLGTRLR